MSLWTRLAAFLPDFGGDESPRTERQQIGDRGERLAAAHLRDLGYLILTRNFRTKHGEIDLVAFRGGVVAFVEVRTVTARTPYAPRHSVGPRKQERVLRAAKRYRRIKDLHREAHVTTRFDVITVRLDREECDHQVEHLPNAFRP